MGGPNASLRAVVTVAEDTLNCLCMLGARLIWIGCLVGDGRVTELTPGMLTYRMLMVHACARECLDGEVEESMTFLQIHIPSFPDAGLAGEECALLMMVPD